MIVEYTPEGAVLMSIFLACIMYFGSLFILLVTFSDEFAEPFNEF